MRTFWTLMLFGVLGESKKVLIVLLGVAGVRRLLISTVHKVPFLLLAPNKVIC